MRKYFILILILSRIVGVAQTDTHVLIDYDTIPCDTTLRQVTINIVDSSFLCPTNLYSFYVDTSSIVYTPPVVIPLDTGKHVLIIADCSGYIFFDTIFINCGTITFIDNLNSFNLEIINYPNPFACTTIIPYYVPYNSKGYLQITDTKGELVDEYALQQGKNKIEISLNGFKAGVYFYSIRIDGVIKQTKKMIVQ